MNKNTITTLTSSFDAMQQMVPDSDVDFCYACDLQELPGYAEGATIENHFVDANKMVVIGSINSRVSSVGWMKEKIHTFSSHLISTAFPAHRKHWCLKRK